ncbi:hypothetical protein FISHEDRAFT_55952 [Fistulina hepatica ATCC 64428]|uniref:DUF6593 domain-containing protein n=1 Tax=Fistulina hepatica ATCC 64428 TaxID=1128425 RepID=A0A0D7AL14_9AGAR|nr:hypothetical protein FISHEDRAFT_55952 [Fistulina hepatica ATCC 64428]
MAHKTFTHDADTPTSEVHGSVRKKSSTPLHTFTFTGKHYLNTQVENTRGRVVYTISTTKRHLRRAVTSIVDARGRLWAEIHWPDRTFRVKNRVFSWDTVKTVSEGNIPFMKKNRVWTWAGRDYVPEYHKEQGWLLRDTLANGVVASFAPSHLHIFNPSEPPVFRICVDDIYSKDTALILLILLYSEARRLRRRRRKHLGIGTAVKVLFVMLLL